MANIKRAVVIGVNQYKDDRITPLTGAVNDASELRDRLVRSGDFEVRDEHFLLDGAATFVKIRKALSDLLWKTDPCGLALFYFSGHGFHDEYGNGFIAPHDVSSREPLVSGIRMQELTEILLASKNKEAAVIILDCCYAGVATEGKAISLAEEPPLQQWFEAVERDGTGQGRIILASSRKDERSREIANCTHQVGEQPPHCHGAFTYQLLEALDGRAADPKGAVTLDRVHSFIDQEMKNDPHHKLSFFAARLSQAQQITLARAGQWTDDRQDLATVNDYLDNDDPFYTFDAAMILRSVLKRSPNSKDAGEQKSKIDSRLQLYRYPSLRWLNQKRSKIVLEIRDDTNALLRELVSTLVNESNRLCFETVIALDEDTRGLLASLCQAWSIKPNSNQTFLNEETFIGMMRAYASSRRQSLAKPENEGGKVLDRRADKQAVREDKGQEQGQVKPEDPKGGGDG